jgi:hypothetical protein
MTRAQQNTIIIDSITADLKDQPNIQSIITFKFNEWFRTLVKQGTEMIAIATAPTGGGGGAEASAGGGAEGAPAPAEG